MAEKIEYILFDCMETLVDLIELPDMEDYALWAFMGSGVEKYWKSFEEYFKDYKLAREAIAKALPEHKEYEMFERFKLIAEMHFHGTGEEKIQVTARKLYDNYWRNYTSKCYVRKEVKDVISELKGKIRLGVVSNFMIQNGIEELLERNAMDSYFDFVITSINVGWRKPHVAIYDAALAKAGTLPHRILFVGDDYLNDYIGPRGMKMHSLVLDRQGKFEKLEDRISDFYGLKEIVFKKFI